MLPTEDLFACGLRADHCRARRDPAAVGPAPGCSDAELLTIVMVRHLLGRRSEAGFLAEVAGDWPHLFPPAATSKRGQPAGPLAAGRL
jgi:hypothetical protein